MIARVSHFRLNRNQVHSPASVETDIIEVNRPCQLAHWSSRAAPGSCYQRHDCPYLGARSLVEIGLGFGRTLIYSGATATLKHSRRFLAVAYL